MTVTTAIAMGEERATHLLRNELVQLGVEAPPDELEKLLFLARRRWNRFDLFAEGETFESRLPAWLQNFDRADRQVAMDLVREITFVSYREIRRLAMCAYMICEDIASERGPTPRGVPWNAYLDTARESTREGLSRTLFVAASDDVLFDYFRRNAQRQNSRLVRDNFVEYYKLDQRERGDLPPHDTAVLLDQFCGSGTSAIRFEHGTWKGKLPKFATLWPEVAATKRIVYLPYLATPVALRNLHQRTVDWKRSGGGPEVLIHPVQSLSVPPCLASADGTEVDPAKPVARLCQKYYDRFVPDRHIDIGGSAVYGYGGAGLAVVLNTNVPNNSVPILWHDDNGWFPLFPRIKHHTLGA